MDNQTNMPKHVAIVMDGNGRWAKRRFMPRIAGHRAGVKAVRKAISFCIKHDIKVLSLFALSIENYLCRPKAEVRFLISLFSDALVRNVNELHQQNICVRVMGDLSILEETLRAQIERSQTLTKNNTGLTLVIAINYSGRWDIMQAAKKMVQQENDLEALIEADFSKHLCLYDLPEPDLLIRTSGEQRISNYMLWQFAYTELCFIPEYWPDFDADTFAKAIAVYQKRERRFGLTGEQATLKEVYAEN